MVRETVHDLRNVVREMPWFAAAVTLSVAIGVGVNASFFDEADGDQIRVSANRIDDEVARFDGAMSRFSHRCAGEKIPGFTVIVALRRYSVELSVPMHGVPPLFDDARASLMGTLDVVDLRRAA
jgi:hypothetical protein